MITAHTFRDTRTKMVSSLKFPRFLLSESVYSLVIRWLLPIHFRKRHQIMMILGMTALTHQFCTSGKRKKREGMIWTDMPGFEKLVHAFDNILTETKDTTSDDMFSGLSSVRSQSDDDTSRSRVLRILDLLAHRAIARQAEAADLSEPQSLVITQSEQVALSESESLTTSRSRTLTSRSKTPRQDRRRPESRRHRAFPADIHRVKSPLIVLEEKLTFTQDMLLAISEGVSMMRP